MYASRMSVAAAGLLFMAAPAPALALDCYGKINRVLLYYDGSVNIFGTWRGDYTYICNVNGGWGGIAPEVCLGWYGLAVKAQGAATNVMLYYNTSTYTCANLPTYGSALAPIYVGVME